MTAAAWAYVIDTHHYCVNGRLVGRVCRPRTWGSAKHLGYYWRFDLPDLNDRYGKERTLRAAKRRVEALWRDWLRDHPLETAS